MACVAEFGAGNLDAPLEQFPGKKAFINETIETVRAQLTRDLRTAKALEVAGTNVMIADADYKIVYTNQSLAKMLSAAESDIRKQLPNFSASGVIGNNIDTFHRNPSHQRHILDNLRSSHRAELEIGGRNFLLIVSPIFDKNGKRAGTVVEWHDRTVEVTTTKDITRVVSAAALGDFTQRVSVVGQEGFLKKLIESMNDLLDKTAAGLTEVIRVFSALSKGDLTERITRDYQGMFGQLKDDSNATVESLAKVIGEVRAAAEQLTSASEQVSSTAQSLSQASSEQAASVEETSASIEQMTASINQNTENAKVTDGMATKASQEATEGGEAVKPDRGGDEADRPARSASSTTSPTRPTCWR